MKFALMLLAGLLICGASVGAFYMYQMQGTANTDSVITTEAVHPPLEKDTEVVEKPKAIEHGTISGKVTIGPICPVEREGVPCPVPIEAYTSRKIVIFKEDGMTEVTRFSLSAEGTYGISLPPGPYVLGLLSNGIDRGEGLPHAFAVVAGSMQIFDFSIDTGIR